MDGLTSLRHIREEEQAGLLAHNLVIALSEFESDPLPEIPTDYSWKCETGPDRRSQSGRYG